MQILFYFLCAEFEKKINVICPKCTMWSILKVTAWKKYVHSCYFISVNLFLTDIPHIKSRAKIELSRFQMWRLSLFFCLFLVYPGCESVKRSVILLPECFHSLRQFLFISYSQSTVNTFTWYIDLTLTDAKAASPAHRMFTLMPHFSRKTAKFFSKEIFIWAHTGRFSIRGEVQTLYMKPPWGGCHTVGYMLVYSRVSPPFRMQRIHVCIALRFPCL